MTELPQPDGYDPMSDSYLYKQNKMLDYGRAEYLRGLNEARPHCKECAKWTKEQADNKEWIEGIKRGKEIIAVLALKEQQT